jgi:biopolymer transport protein TolR
MAHSTNDAFSVGRGRGRRRSGRRRGALAEINVTPLVDVMLVLLIIFMISAPLLTVGVPVELPKTEASSVNDQTQPLTITVRQDASIYIQENQTPFDQLSTRLTALAGDGFDKPIFVRADGKAPYEVVAQVMAALSSAGFSKINLITDTGGPSSGTVRRPAQPPAQTGR